MRRVSSGGVLLEVEAMTTLRSANRYLDTFCHDNLLYFKLLLFTTSIPAVKTPVSVQLTTNVQ